MKLLIKLNLFLVLPAVCWAQQPVPGEPGVTQVGVLANQQTIASHSGTWGNFGTRKLDMGFSLGRSDVDVVGDATALSFSPIFTLPVQKPSASSLMGTDVAVGLTWARSDFDLLDARSFGASFAYLPYIEFNNDLRLFLNINYGWLSTHEGGSGSNNSSALVGGFGFGFEKRIIGAFSLGGSYSYMIGDSLDSGHLFGFGCSYWLNDSLGFGLGLGYTTQEDITGIEGDNISLNLTFSNSF